MTHFFRFRSTVHLVSSAWQYPFIDTGCFHWRQKNKMFTPNELAIYVLVVVAMESCHASAIAQP